MKPKRYPRIYVACLAAYNNGKLHGVWIDADRDPDEIRDEVNDMLAGSPEPNAEEWAIHDYEDFDPLSLSESSSFEEVSRLAKLIAEHGEAFAVFAGNYGDGADEDDFNEAYQGHHDSEQSFAEQLFDDLGYGHELPGHLHGYFNWQAFTRDLFLSDYWSSTASDGGVHVFRNI